MVLGGWSAIEVLTGRKPDSAAKLTMWSGLKMKEAITRVMDVSVIEQY